MELKPGPAAPRVFPKGRQGNAHGKTGDQHTVWCDFIFQCARCLRDAFYDLQGFQYSDQVYNPVAITVFIIVPADNLYHLTDY